MAANEVYLILMKKTDRFGMRVAPDEKQEWERAAAANGIGLSEWASQWLRLGVAAEKIWRKDKYESH